MCCGKDTLKRACGCFFHSTSPLGGQSQPRVFSKKSLSEAQAQGHLRSRMGDGFSESRASLLVKGFESTAPAWLAQAQPLRFSAHPCKSCPSVVPKMILLLMILPEKESRDERPGSRALTGYPVVTPEPHGAQEDNPLLPRALMILSTMILPEIFQSMSHLPPEREYLMIHQMARTPSFQLIFLPSA